MPANDGPEAPEGEVKSQAVETPSIELEQQENRSQKQMQVITESAFSLHLSDQPANSAVAPFCSDDFSFRLGCRPHLPSISSEPLELAGALREGGVGSDAPPPLHALLGACTFFGISHARNPRRARLSPRDIERRCRGVRTHRGIVRETTLAQ
jgi:hypothetical protein